MRHASPEALRIFWGGLETYVQARMCMARAERHFRRVPSTEAQAQMDPQILAQGQALVVRAKGIVEQALEYLLDRAAGAPLLGPGEPG